MTRLLQSLKSGRRWWWAAAALSLLALVVAVITVNRWNRQLTAARQQLEDAARVEVEQSPLRPPASDGLRLYLHTEDVRATAVFQNQRYLATSGGLLAFDESGSFRRRYTSLDGLTDNDLTALAVFGNRLFIGTATAGMMAFDANTFTAYRFSKPRATRVSVLLATATELLIGTLDGGLFEYDGERFSRRLNAATGADFAKVTALLAEDSRLYIGTQDKGLYLWREAQFRRFSTTEGLPAERVTGLAALPGTGDVVVATDFGVSRLSEAGDLSEFSKQANITSLAVSRGRLYAGLFSGGILELTGGAAAGASNVAAGEARQDAGGARLTLPISERRKETAARPPTLVFAEPGSLWALTRAGAFIRDEEANRQTFEPFFLAASATTNQDSLAAAHISSLALEGGGIGGGGRLWVGYFDSGIDVIAPESGERLLRLEDERVREVNFITFDRANDRALVATSRGLVALDHRLQQSVMTRQQSGLIDDAVAHVALVDEAGGRGSRLILATAGGLTDYSQGRARSITAFHGLASNHLYTSAAVGARLFVGSLAGLIEMEGLRVVRAYKRSNSKLSADWVTALVEAEGVLYIGTVDGIDALLPTGEMVNFTEELGGKIEVNLNAMHADGERVYVGTSDKGLFAYNVRDRRWSRVSAGLSSQNVTAIASDDRFLYVGTLNGLVRIEKRVIG